MGAWGELPRRAGCLPPSRKAASAQDRAQSVGRSAAQACKCTHSSEPQQQDFDQLFHKPRQRHHGTEQPNSSHVVVFGPPSPVSRHTLRRLLLPLTSCVTPGRFLVAS